MICKNCGAEMDDGLLLCPYCQSENEKIAKKEQDEYIQSYKDKTKELENLPDKVVKKSSKYLIIIAGAALALFVVCIIVAFILRYVVGDTSLSARNKHIEKLETYYNDGEYDKMWNYLDSKELNGSSYEKYSRVYFLYDGMDWKIETVINEAKIMKELDLEVENVATTLSFIIEELVDIKSMEEEGFPYDEGEAVLEIKEKYVSVLNEHMLLTEEEIEEAVDTYIEKKNCNDIAELALERIKAN